MAPRILIFSIAIGADYSYELKNSDIRAPTFFKQKTAYEIGSGLVGSEMCIRDRFSW